MNQNQEPAAGLSEMTEAKKDFTVKIIGVGGAGVQAIEQMADTELSTVKFVAINTDCPALDHCKIREKIYLGVKRTRGLGIGGDPELARAVAEEDAAAIRAVCAGAELIVIVTGLGGGTGTGVAPVLARLAKEAGAQVLAFVTMPFDCEGSRRQRQARAGLLQLKAEADGVLCLPNQKVLKLIDENTSLVETFRITNDLLAQVVRCILRLLTRPGFININFADLCAVVQGRQAESSFAMAEAMGENRAREVIEKLFAHPLLDGGRVLSEADTVLVSLIGGTDLTMAEVNRVMEQINRQCEQAHVTMGAAMDDSLKQRLTVTIIASQHTGAETGGALLTASGNGSDETTSYPSAVSGERDGRCRNEPLNRPPSRFTAPAPNLSPEKASEFLSQQNNRSKGRRRSSSRLRQGQLPLEIVSKGRFEKSEPTIHQGEDLDVPTYIRRGVPLN
jgi:cell division protein FtsZ